MNTLSETKHELGARSAIEELFTLIEAHKISSSYDYFPLDDLYDLITSFDQGLQKLTQDNDDRISVQFYNEYIERSIKYFVTLFQYKGLSDYPIYYGFKRYISILIILFRETNRLTNESDLTANVMHFASVLHELKSLIRLMNLDSEPGLIESAIQAFEEKFCIEVGIDITLSGNNSIQNKEYTFFCNDWTEKKFRLTRDLMQSKFVSEQFYMRMSIFVGESKSATDLLSPIWLIISSLESIENVNIKIDKISTGSLKIDLINRFKDLTAKEETKAVLQTGVEIVVKALSGADVSYTGVKKGRQETDKIRLEKEILEIEKDSMPSKEQAKISNQLDIDKKRLENEKQRLENMNAKIEIFSKLSDLVAKGLLEPDTIRIDINDVLLLLKNGDDIKEIGPNISEIS